MKKYAVKEVANMSGITIRTLHHYDKIGLLKPLYRAESRYRYYGEAELLRLQQILFYKELGFPLQEIKEVLDDPDFELIAALENHKAALLTRQQRIDTLLRTIDQTIINLTHGNTMKNPKELYEGLPKEVGTTYRDAAIAEYGKEMVEHAEQELMKLGKEGFKQLQAEFDQINRALFDRRTENPEGDAVQQLIIRHYGAIRAFWGTAGTEDPQAEAYAGLGQLYVADERFTVMDGQPQPEFALFLQKAMEYFADTSLV